jgi:ribonuclease PH
VDLNVVKNAAGHFIEVQGTAENQPFTPDSLQSMLNLADQGIHEVISRQTEVLQDFQ